MARPERIDGDSLGRGALQAMKSKLFAQFGIPDAECQITFVRDHTGVPRLMFRSKGRPSVALDHAVASELRHLLVMAGDINGAYEIDRHMETARRSRDRMRRMANAR